MVVKESIPTSVESGVTIVHHDITHDVYNQITAGGKVAWDIETNGLDPLQAQIGTCQLHSPTVGTYVITGVAGGQPRVLSDLLKNPRVLKVFHHAPFDLSFMAHAWEAMAQNVACTKIGAKLLDPHAPQEQFSLKYLMLQHFGIDLDKQTRFTDWVSGSLTDRQIDYAVSDVVRLLDLYELLRSRLESRGLDSLYGRCCEFLPTHVALRLHGRPDPFKY